MDGLTFVIAVSIIHCCLFFFDVFFKSCSHYPYLYFLRNTGLEIHVFQIRWFTTSFNRFIQKCGSWRPKFLDTWFSLGVRCSLVLFPVAIYIVIKTAVLAWNTNLNIDAPKQALIIEPMIPGLNLPLSDIGYYMATIIICSAVHEFGHAVAAVRQDVHISGIGLTILIIVPVIYVLLNTEQYEALPARRQLSIVCAGVWHNFVVAVIAYLMLMSLPTLLLPFYDADSGVVVQSIDQTSPALGPSGLSVGDKIVAVNQHQIKDFDSWYHSLTSAIKMSSPGYCVSSELVRIHDESVSVKQLPGGAVECCSSSSPTHLCFEYLDNDENMPELPQHSCLPGRVVIESAQALCERASDCILDRHCLKPSLTNQTRLLRIERERGKLVIFLGHPSEIYQTVKVSNFVPKYIFLSPVIPEVLMKFCLYVILFSSGLAVINIIPCFRLDGQHIVIAACTILLAKKLKRSMRQAVAFTITFVGSLLIFVICVSMILSSLF